ncbi:MAG TPA: penicillin-binding protein 2 [Candidatus Kapabacteria bacterium]|nr:penicillin-binding protein 2 [Candidatus Kapabacteria bacterium]
MFDFFSDQEFASPTRRRIFAAVIAIVFAGFIARFVELQILEGTELRGAASAQGIKRIERIPARGAIYDRYGTVVAASIPSYAVTITPEDFLPYRKQTLPVLASLLGVDTTYIINKLNQSGSYVKFQPVKIIGDIDVRTIAAIEEHLVDLPGIDISVESKRQYVAPVRASHLLGFTKEISEQKLENLDTTADSSYYHPGDIVGTTGLEAFHEDDLRGRKGYEYVAVDARGQRQARFKEGAADIKGLDGESIQLGMDLGLQEYAEQLLQGLHGAIVALDPSTGEILALVSKPDFDLDIFSGRTSKAEYQSVMLDPAHPLYNRATQTRYPPGSTWKLLMAAATMQTKTWPMNYVLNCPGSFTFGDHTYNDDAVHGATNFHKSIVASCDVFYYRAVLALGIDSMAKYAHDFGFGLQTGVDLAYEGNGTVPSTAWMNKHYPRGWTKGYVVSQGIGQGEVGVTPLQQAAYAATWANHGVWVQPHAARAIFNNQTRRWENFVPKKHHVSVSDTIVEVVRNAMFGVVHEGGGTGHACETPGPHDCQIAGKTGTAQNPHGKSHAWFDCFAPFDNPKIAMCVLVENAGFGGDISAPICRKLIKYYLYHDREDPLPTLLPNTPEYNNWRENRFAKQPQPAPQKKDETPVATSNEAVLDEKR